jgi:hypothetical protein
MPSSQMLRRVALVRTDVSEELLASIIRVKRIVELGTLAVTNNDARCEEITCSQITDSCHPDCEGATFLRNVGSFKATQRNIPEDSIFHGRSWLK